MTGTAETEAPEFDKIYKLEVLAIPTNRPLIRVENPDVVYRTEREKFEAVVEGDRGAATRPGARCWWAPSPSRSPSTSPRCSSAHGIKHVVLNAKYHEREAEIVAQAGRFGAVTIATNMAGRGTDIILGGVPDHRMQGDPASSRSSTPDQATPEQRAGGPRPGRRPRWRGTSRRPWRERKVSPEERRTLAKRYVGILAAFAADHPSVLVAGGAGAGAAHPARLPRGRARAAARDQGEDRPQLLPAGREAGGLPGGPPAEGATSTAWPPAPELETRRGLPGAERARAGGGPGRPAHPGHRAPRGPPHRQPAARPRRPPGRPRLLALLPLARGRPHAHLRLRPHQRPDAEAGHGGGRAHRARDGDEVDRARAEAGGGAELRRPQAPARVRRRDEQAAQGRLRHAPHDPRGQGRPRATS